MGGDRGDAAVHPDYRGRGVGTALAGWMQARARAAGAAVIGMPVPAGSDGDRLLEALGYHVRWNSWELKLPEGATVPERDTARRLRDPRGHARTTTRPAGRSSRTPSSSGRCASASPSTTSSRAPSQRPGFEPWNLRLVSDPAATWSA